MILVALGPLELLDHQEILDPQAYVVHQDALPLGAKTNCKFFIFGCSDLSFEVTNLLRACTIITEIVTINVEKPTEMSVIDHWQNVSSPVLAIICSRLLLMTKAFEIMVFLVLFG